MEGFWYELVSITLKKKRLTIVLVHSVPSLPSPGSSLGSLAPGMRT